MNAPRPKRARRSQPVPNAATPPAIEQLAQQIQHAPVSKEELERAKRARARTVGLVSGLEPFAQQLSGNSTLKVAVRGDIPSSMTDGQTIWVKPDIALGDHIEHQRRVCGVRDPKTESQLCPACRMMDDTSGKFHHELAHIVEGSFGVLSDEQKAEVLTNAIAEGGTKAGTRAAKLLELIERQGKGVGFMQAAGLVSPWLPMLVNALEDARVNKGMAKQLPGLMRIFRARVRETMAHGHFDEHGGTIFWSEQDPDMQAFIGAYLVCAGYEDLLVYLDPAVQEALRAKSFRRAVFKLEHAKSAASVYGGAYGVLEALREEGFCKKPDDPEDDEEEGPGEDEEESTTITVGIMGGDAGGGGKGDEPGDEDQPKPDIIIDLGGDADEDETDEDETDEDEPGDTGSSGPDMDLLARLMAMLKGHNDDNRTFSETDEKDDQAMAQAEAQFDKFDDLSPNIFSLHVHEWGKPVVTPSGVDRSAELGWNKTVREYQDSTERLYPLPGEALLAKSVQHARLVFAENRAVHSVAGFRAGFVDSRRLALVATGEQRVFMRRATPDTRDYEALIGLDISGSTSGRRNVLIKRMAYGMSELFHRVGVNFSLYAHTAWHSDIKAHMSYGHRTVKGVPLPGQSQYSMTEDVDIYEIKRSDMPWNVTAKEALDALCAAANNLDGHTLEFYRKQIEGSRAAVKLLFYVTDGAMPASNYDEERAILMREIKICRELGIHLIGIGIETDSPKEYGLDTIEVQGAEDLPMVIREVEKRLVIR